MKEFNCKQCNKVFKAYPCKKQVYCSRECVTKDGRYGFQKGCKPKISAEARKRQGRTLSKKYIGKGNPGWKGDKISVHALHTWIRRHYGRPSEHQCTLCEEQAHDWANINHEYKRDIDDFLPMCRKCHTKHDYENGLRLPTNQYNQRNHE